MEKTETTPRKWKNADKSADKMLFQGEKLI